MQDDWCPYKGEIWILTHAKNDYRDWGDASNKSKNIACCQQIPSLEKMLPPYPLKEPDLLTP